MPHSLEERVAYLEGKVEEQTRNFGDLANRIDGLSARIDALDQKMSSQFVWLVGMQVAVLLAVIGALLR